MSPLAYFRSVSGVFDIQGATVGDDTATFEAESELGPVSVTLTRVPEPGEYKVTVECRQVREISDGRYEALATLAVGEAPADWDLSREEVILDDGRVITATLPPSLKNLFSESFASMGLVARSTVRSLRLRYGLRVPLRGQGHISTQYSLDGHAWVTLIPEISARATAYAIGTPLNGQLARELSEVVAAYPGVAVSHELLFEAEELETVHLRSALVLSLSAVEVGLKRLIATLVPGSEWLVASLPSPPTDRIIQHMLPTLPVLRHLPGTTTIAPKPELLDELKKAIKLRNDLVHSGRVRIEFDWLHPWLDLCSSLLYAFDCFAGEAWAGPLVNPGHVHLISS